MPKDKRLLITKAVIGQIQRACGSAEKAEAIAIELTFVVPPKAIANDDPVRTQRFQLPHPTAPSTGRIVAVILPTALVADAHKVNTRHRLVDAVVPGEMICARTAESSRKALQVATGFEKFIVDERIVASLPTELKSAISAGKAMVVMPAVEPGRDLVHQMTICARSTTVTMDHAGKLRLRIGHAGMTAGEITENAKSFIAAVKAQSPQVYRHILEFKLESSKTEPIRFVEAQIARN